MASRRRPIEVPLPPGAVAATGRIGGVEHLVVAFDAPARGPWPKTLTSAERAVADLMIEGASSAEVARLRGRSARTIANQIASIYRKLGIGSRAELALLASHASHAAPSHASHAAPSHAAPSSASHAAPSSANAQGARRGPARAPRGG